MNTSMIIGVFLIVILGIAGYFFLGSEDAMMEKDNAIMEKESAMETDAIEKAKIGGDESMMEGAEDSMKKEEGSMMTQKGTIEAYRPEKLALAESGKVLLFFHAPWCPVCRAFDAEAAANSNIVPDGIHILKVDYDTETALKQKYGVTYQHTFVQVDSKGISLGKWSDASTYAQVFARVK